LSSDNHKCGLIFNRHKWHLPTRDYRICVKCGRTEEYDHGWYAGGVGWTWQNPVSWHKDVSYYRKIRKESKETNDLKAKELLEMIYTDGLVHNMEE